MPLENFFHHFWAIHFNSLLISEEPKRKEMVLKTLGCVTLRSITVTDIPRDHWAPFLQHLGEILTCLPTLIHPKTPIRNVDIRCPEKAKANGSIPCWSSLFQEVEGISCLTLFSLRALHFHSWLPLAEGKFPAKTPNPKNHLDFQAARRKFSLLGNSPTDMAKPTCISVISLETHAVTDSFDTAEPTAQK